jgi:hypothetical protein
MEHEEVRQERRLTGNCATRRLPVVCDSCASQGIRAPVTTLGPLEYTYRPTEVGEKRSHSSALVSSAALSGVPDVP